MLPPTLIEAATPATPLWNEIILKACHAEVAFRHQNAAELVEDLLRLQQSMK
jgi:hypothetical protein